MASEPVNLSNTKSKMDYINRTVMSIYGKYGVNSFDDRGGDQELAFHSNLEYDHRPILQNKGYGTTFVSGHEKGRDLLNRSPFESV